MRDRKKVCIIAPVHDWDDVRVFQKQAVTVANSGYDVTLLAQADSSRLESGVNVKPVVSPRSPRIVRFLLLPVVFLQAIKVNADLYHLHNPDTLPLALALKVLGKKVIYDSHEDFERRILLREWVPGPLRRMLGFVVSSLERLASQFVDATIVTQQNVADRLGRRSVVIGNAPRIEVDLFDRVDRLAGDIQDDFIGLRAVYIGSIDVSRGLLEMVDALELANVSVPMRLWLVGPVNERDLAIAKGRRGWGYVDYVERQPQEKAFAYVRRADVGLVTLRDIGDHRYTDPNKIYEYLAFGVPFIASDFPVWRKRFDEKDVGWFVPPGDGNALAKALVEAAASPALRGGKGRLGQEFVSNYNWQQLSRRLLLLYGETLNRSGHRPA